MCFFNQDLYHSSLCYDSQELEYDFRCLDWGLDLDISYTINKKTGNYEDLIIE